MALLYSGYLKWFAPVTSSPKSYYSRNFGDLKFQLEERYAELVGRQLSFFTKPGIPPSVVFSVQGFCQWSGDEYGLEIKTSNPNERVLIAAFNRLDLENWTRGIMAAVDPDGDAAANLRRQRRRARKQIRKAQEEEEDRKNALREKEKRVAEIEYLRRIEREEEIQQMTPLERSDGLGSLDQDTKKVLERRRMRRQRRVGKQAYRRRVDEAAGGKVLPPLSQKQVELRPKVRIEAPPPGKFYEVSQMQDGDVFLTRQESRPLKAADRSSTPSSGDLSDSSLESQSESHSLSEQPPPPPLTIYPDDDDFIPPPPESPLKVEKDISCNPHASIKINPDNLKLHDDMHNHVEEKLITDSRTKTPYLGAEGKSVSSRSTSTDGNSRIVIQKVRKGLFDDSSDEDGSIQPRETFAQKRETNANCKELSSPLSGKGDAHFLESKSGVSVKHISNEVKVGLKKTYAVYTFEWRILGDHVQIHRFSMSYHEISDIHDRLGSLRSKKIKFPSKHWYRDNRTPLNMSKRAVELKHYFEALLKLPEAVECEQFKDGYRIPHAFLERLKSSFGKSSSTPSSASKVGEEWPSPSPSISIPGKLRNHGHQQRIKKITNKDSLFSEGSDSSSSCTSMEAPNPVAYPVPLSDDHSSEDLSSGELSDNVEPQKNKIERCGSMLPSKSNLLAGGRGALLAAIRQGTELTAKESVRAVDFSTKTSTPKASLPPQEKKINIGDAISNAMAMRRTQVETENCSAIDSDADSSEWD